MAIEFTNKPIKWTNEGTAPSEDLKTNGFQAGYKPPAAVFNKQWHTTGECIDELQTKLSDADDKKVDKVTGKSLIDENVANNIEYYKDNSGYPHIGINPAGMECCVFSYDGLKIAEITHPSHSVILSTTEGLTIQGEMDVSLRKGPSGGTLHKLSEKANSSDVLTKTNTTTFAPTGDYNPATKKYVDDNKTNIVDDLKTMDNTSALSALQGYNLRAQISDMPIRNVEGRKVGFTTTDGTTTSTSYTPAEEGATVICDTYLGDLASNLHYSYPKSGVGHNVAVGRYSISAGEGSAARGQQSLAAGYICKANGLRSVALGDRATAGGQASFAIGYSTNATENAAVAMGHNATASGFASFAMGSDNTASGSHAFVAGIGNNGLDYQTKIGAYAKDGTKGAGGGTAGDAFIIGNGTFSTLSNAFRVAYDGSVYGLASYSSSGADYAEYFEWKDGNTDNEDRRGRLVTLDGEKIRFATADDDYILGVVSANPCIEGDVYSDDWQGKYLTDVFGQRLTQTVHIPARYEEQKVIDPETGETTTENILVEEEHDAVQWVLNPEYDPEQEYVSREDRKEWSAIGLMGKLVVVDDGTCEVNGFCKAGVNGIATKSRDIEGLPTNDGYRVMARIDDTHIRVLVR